MIKWALFYSRHKLNLAPQLLKVITPRGTSKGDVYFLVIFFHFSRCIPRFQSQCKESILFETFSNYFAISQVMLQRYPWKTHVFNIQKLLNFFAVEISRQVSM